MRGDVPAPVERPRPPAIGASDPFRGSAGESLEVADAIAREVARNPDRVPVPMRECRTPYRRETPDGLSAFRIRRNRMPTHPSDYLHGFRVPVRETCKPRCRE